MMGQRLRPAASLLGALLLGLWHTAPAGAVEFGPCPEHFGFSCTTVPVPLDRSGRLPGTIALKLERKQAGATQSPNALIALSGGPGQAAVPSAEAIAKSMAPALGTRDLVVFDQRGTGQSSPLNCPALSSEEAFAQAGSLGRLFDECALQIGAARAAFTTQESVGDIETIRQTLGYDKLVLRGVSYGTKVALAYAERYPQHVEALLLDSTVASDGPEAFALPTLRAIAPMLAELCSASACAHITAKPLTELAQLATRMRSHALSGSVYDGSGARHGVHIAERDLLLLLEAGDLNPGLRALLPAAVHSALNHDPDPLLRLDLLSRGAIPSLPKPTGPSPEEEEDEEDNALFWATSCEEKPFPWVRSDPPAKRETELSAALLALPSSAFYPFDADTALEASPILPCLGWPDASPPPPPPSPLPGVPTLILSGGQDLRTPTSEARRVAALIPGAQLLRVPFTGHSVLGTDFSGCAKAAVANFFGGVPVSACPSRPRIFKPTPVTPTKLDRLHPAPGLGRRAGRTVTAAYATIVDLEHQAITASLQLNAKLPSGTSFGGLRGGFAKLGSETMRLSRFSFVTGVQLSGSFTLRSGTRSSASVRIGGPAATAGKLRIGPGSRVTGTIGARHIDLSLSKATTSRVSAPNPLWPSSTARFAYPGLAHTG